MEERVEYYDGTKLLSLTDINGNKPEIYICTSNRSAGKTTYFNRLMVNRFLQKGEKFSLLYRYQEEVSSAADKFFKEIGRLFFPGLEMIGEPIEKGKAMRLYMTPYPENKSTYKNCGYAIALNSADRLKKLSHLFADTDNILFDEFQSETGNYCSDEIIKFQSIHMSIARGEGKQSRYVPVYMLSNPVTLINPYYTALGISTRLRDNTKFLRGNGWVLEQGYNDSAAKAQEESIFNRAFAGSQSSYQAYASQGIYLNDNLAFVEKLDGRNRYVCTIRYNGKDFGVRSYDDLGIMYCDTNPDPNSRYKFAITTDDHQVNYVLLVNNQVMMFNWRYLFEQGCFRFKNLDCKEAIMTAVSY